MTSLPDPGTSRQLCGLINYRNVLLDENNSTAFLREKKVWELFWWIRKGYAAEKAKSLCKQKGVKSGIVNAAGDLSAWGYQPNGKKKKKTPLGTGGGGL